MLSKKLSCAIRFLCVWSLVFAAGQVTPAEGGNTANQVPDQVSLTSGSSSASFDPKTGAIAALIDSDLSWIVPSNDVYRLLLPGEVQTLATEAEDVVIRCNSSDRSVEFLCKNDKLPGVKIQKRYYFDEQHQLHKRMSFQFLEQRKGFLDWSTVVQLRPEARKGGYYTNPLRHPIEKAHISADNDVTTLKPMPAEYGADYHLVFFWQPGRDRTLGTFRYKYDDQFIHVLDTKCERQSLFYTPQGWEMGVGVYRWKPGKPQSYEVVYFTCPGDIHDAYRLYQEMPDFAREQDYPTPEWVKNIKVNYEWLYGDNEDKQFAQIREVVDTYQDGYVVVFLNYTWSWFQNYVFEGEWKTRSGYPLDVEKLKDMIARIKAISPRIKVGVYNWWWSTVSESHLIKEHPEWFICDANGKHREMWGAPAFLMNDEYRKFIIGVCDRILGELGVDYYYIDGGQGAMTLIDWSRQIMATPLDWRQTYKEMLATVQKHGEDKAFFMNGTNGLYTMYNHMSYFEGIDCFPVKDWRAVADRLYLLKCHQKAGRWISPLYWPINPPNKDYFGGEDYLLNCVLFGLSPSLPLQIGNDWMKAHRPCVNALTELKDDTMLLANPVAPVWWRVESPTCEAYAFKTPENALAVTFLNHGQSNPELSFSLPEEFRSAKRFYVWLQRPNMAQGPLDWYKGLTDLEEKQQYGQAWAFPESLVTNAYLGTVEPSAEGQISLSVPDGVGKMVRFLLTDSPALAMTECSHPRQFWKPVSCVQSSDDTCTIALDEPADIVLPLGKVSQAVPLWRDRSGAIQNTWLTEDNQGNVLQIVSLGKGEWRLDRSGDAAGIEKSVEIDLPDSKLRPGESLPVKFTKGFENGKAGEFFASLTLNGALVQRWAISQSSISSTGETAVQLAPSLETGRYTFTMIQADGQSIRVSPPVSFDIDSGQKRYNHNLVDRSKKIQQEWKGLKVTRVFEQDRGASDGDFATVELGKDVLRVKAGIDPASNLTYGFAGVEIAVKDKPSLTVKAKMIRPIPELECCCNYGEGYMGLTADYHTPAGYARRLYIPFMGMKKILSPGNGGKPFWGTGHPYEAVKVMDVRVYNDVRFSSGEKEFILDLARYAPKDWDGMVILGAMNYVGGRESVVEAEVISASPSAFTGLAEDDPLRWPAVTNFECKHVGMPVRGMVIERFLVSKKLDEKMASGFEKAVKQGKLELWRLDPGKEKIAFGLDISGAYVLRMAFDTPKLKAALANTSMILDYPAMGENGVVTGKRVILQNSKPANTDLTSVIRQLGSAAAVENDVLPETLFSSRDTRIDINGRAPAKWTGDVRIWIVIEPKSVSTFQIFENETFYLF